jgi:hypothetical protein
MEQAFGAEEVGKEAVYVLTAGWRVAVEFEQ